MRIAICEDTPRDMETMLDLIDRYAGEAGYRIETLHYAHADALLADIQSRAADIMVLDIMMPGPEGSRPAGIALARTLRADGYGGAIVFTTTSDDFYPEGFEVGAAHYLIKPVAYEGMRTALDRAMLLVKEPQRMITVPVNRIQLTIPRSLVRYAEVYGRETILHTAAEKLRVLLPLKKIETQLEGDPFLRCYRSYIINMDYVKAMGEDHFLLQGDVRVPISIRTRQAIRERFFTYRMTQIQ